MSACPEHSESQSWNPAFPHRLDGLYRIPLPDQFEVTEAWWNDVLYAQKGRFPQITAERFLTLHEGTWETSRVSVGAISQIALWMEAGEDDSGCGGFGLSSSASFTLPSGARRSSCGSWISPRRMPDFPRPWKEPLGIVPDLIFEVLPPSLRLYIMHEKMLEWIAGGVRLGWLIDPFERTVRIYRENGDVELLNDPAELSGEDVCAGLVVDMSRVWD